jgi:beta-lactamase regulating signal transducer with metallopeptidase domain
MNDSLGGIETLFSLLLRAAWSAGILLAVVWCVDCAARRWISPRVRYALWLLVAARLVMLWTPASSLSLVGQFEDGARYFASFPRAPVGEPLDAAPLRLESDLANANIEPEMMLETMEWDSPAASAPVKMFWSAWTVWTLVAAAWGVGALFFAGKLLIDFCRLRAAMRKMEVVESGDVMVLLRKIEKEVFRSPSWFAARTAGRASSGAQTLVGSSSRRVNMALGVPNAMPPIVEQKLRLLVCERLASPAVTGVLRPALLLPRVFLDQLTLSELEHVFRHELTHVKRRDVLVNWVLAWLGAVYWFFPLMRFLLGQLRKTRELACDAAVLAKATAAERAAYGKTLVRVLEMAAVGDRPVLTFTVGVAGMVWPMGNSRRESRMMRERLELVIGGRSAGKLAIAMAATLLTLLTLVGFTEGQEKKEPNAAGEVVAAAFVAKDVDSGDEYRWIENSYDFSETRKLFEKSPEFFKMPALTSAAPSPGAPPVKVDVVVSARQVMREWVERVIKESGWTVRMDPTISWYEDDKATISHSYKSHERLARALKVLHTTPESQYVFEFSVGTLDADDFGKINVKDFRVATNDSMDLRAELAAPKSASASLHSEETISRRIPSQRLFLNDEELKRLLTALSAKRSFERVSAPKVTMLNTQSVMVTVGEERPYVTGIWQAGGGKTNPKVESVFCGLQIDQQAIALGDAKIWLRLKCRQTEVLGVTEEIAPGTEITIQSPKIWLMSQSAGLEMKLGETLAIFSKSSGREGKKDQVLAMFVTVREVYLPPLPEPLVPDVAPVKTAAIENDHKTEVFDVSGTPTLHWFASKMKNDEQLRPMLIAPALDQLERFIKQTIDPESPKTIERSTENLTLEVTASQEVLEKVGDLIKQLTRLTEKENFGLLVAYDVSSLPCFGGIDVTRASREELTKDSIADAFAEVVHLIDRKLRSSGDKSVEVQPFIANPALTIFVAATEKEQEKVAELLKQLNAMPVSEFEKLAEQDGAGKSTNQAAIVRDLTTLNSTSAAKEATPTTDKSVAVAYDVTGLPFFRKFIPDFKSGKRPAQEVLLAEFAKVETIVNHNIDAFVEKMPGVEVQAFPGNLTIIVIAPQETQEKVAELLKRLSSMTPEDCEKEAKRASAPKVHVDAAGMETQDPLLLNEVRKGVEFVPPKHGKARTSSRETSEESRPSRTDLSAEDQAIFKALEQRVEVTFTDKPLSEVLKLFGETTKINIVPDNAAFVEEGIQVNELVSLDLRQPVKLRSALRLILDPLNLGFMVKNEVLLVTSKRLTHGKRTTIAYDVAGLPFFKEFKTDLKNQEEPNKSAIAGAFERLGAVIKNTIPAFKAEKEPAELQPFYTNLTLVVSAAVEDQEKVADLLKHIERMSLEDAEKLVKAVQTPQGQPYWRTSTVEALRTPPAIPRTTNGSL